MRSFSLPWCPIADIIQCRPEMGSEDHMKGFLTGDCGKHEFALSSQLKSWLFLCANSIPLPWLLERDNVSDHRVRTEDLPFQTARKPDFACSTPDMGVISNRKAGWRMWASAKRMASSTWATIFEALAVRFASARRNYLDSYCYVAITRPLHSPVTAEYLRWSLMQLYLGDQLRHPWATNWHRIRTSRPAPARC